MRYYVKKPGTRGWTTITTDSLAAEVDAGRVEREWPLKGDDNRPDSSVGTYLNSLNPMPNSGSFSQSQSSDISASSSPLDLTTNHNPTHLGLIAARRYRDGYFAAHAINGMGSGIKSLAIAIAVIMTLISFLIGSSTSAMFGLAGALLGTAIAAPLYVLGILVSAQAQLMKATMDTAVHTSPFLDSNQKAAAMSLK